jgi:anti-anti-sigma factor
MTVPSVAAPATGTLPTQRSGALQELASSLRGELALPGSPTYAALTSPFNASVVQRPLAVAAVADAYDVAQVVRAANRHGLRVAVQCTGHGAEATLEDVLLVHTGALAECVVHPEGWARVGAGVRWRAVIDAAAPLGLTPLAGSASGVGVVGYTTGGGLGPLARTFGAASDRVRALDVVTGGGRLLRATPTEHRDLFWALRGGKGAAGVVTAIEFDLVPLTHVYGGALHFDGADAARVLHLWRTWAPALPETATTSIAVRQLPPLPHVPAPLAGRMTVAVRLASTAPQDEAAALLDPLRAVASPVFGGTGLLPVTELDVIHSDPPQPVPVQDRAVLLRELTAQTVDALLAVAGAGLGLAAGRRGAAPARRRPAAGGRGAERVPPGRRLLGADDRAAHSRHDRRGGRGRGAGARGAGPLVDGRDPAEPRPRRGPRVRRRDAGAAARRRPGARRGGRAAGGRHPSLTGRGPGGTIPPMYLTVGRTAAATQTVLTVRGELDIATVGTLRDQVDDVLAEPPPRLVLDLSGTSFLDSKGCRELARAAKGGKAVGVDVVLVVPPENRPVRRIVDFMQFGALLPVHDSLPTA